ncbi:hypothetical protein FACS1894211_11710 [Clostridia bacterium]|nr:hypothetical protein FACS1894211_11710 [Clostridia bacterium]
MYLETINSSADLKALRPAELLVLCAEIRQYMLDGLKVTGGHLASNLGAVELTAALHYTFDCPDDKLIFDVGHQSYVHKILTGRREAFLNIRREGGISGFPKREESPCDAFGTGHASTSVSAGLGIARARDLTGGTFHVVCVLGDGALAGGMAYEALNDAGQSKTPLIVVLNDNRMSIGKTPGGVSRHLARLRIRPRYTAAKARFRSAVLHFPFVGKEIYGLFSAVKGAVKRAVLPDALFEQMGLKYVGPIDGHNLDDLISCFNDAKREKGPLLIHVTTQKGKGLAEAEDAPEAFHGVDGNGQWTVGKGQVEGTGHRAQGIGDNAQCTMYNAQLKDDNSDQWSVVSGQLKDDDKGQVKDQAANCALCTVNCELKKADRLFSEAVGKKLAALADADPAIVAITAGMAEGTGLNFFGEKHPDRFFDAGIAEQHAVTLAAGLAAGGLKPYVAIYSTFLQRAYDQILHDVCLQKLPVTFLIDRAGVVGADGRTHQGIYDLSYLAAMPNAVICAPADIAEAEIMLEVNAQLGGSGQWSVVSGQLKDDNKGQGTSEGNREQGTGIGCHSSVSEEAPSIRDNAQCAPHNAQLKDKTDNRSLFIRYPKAESGVFTTDREKTAREIAAGKWGVVKAGKSRVTVLCAGGRMLKAAIDADRILRAKKIDIGIINARFVSPLDTEMLKRIAEETKRPFGGRHLIVSTEDGVAEGGFGERVRAALAEYDCKFVPLALPVKSVEHCAPESAFHRYGLDGESLAKTVLEKMKIK